MVTHLESPTSTTRKQFPSQRIPRAAGIKGINTALVAQTPTLPTQLTAIWRGDFSPINGTEHRHIRIVAETCPDCGGSKCSTCNQCHYCEDIDLPCGSQHRTPRMVAASGAGRGGNVYPPVCISYPDDWQRDLDQAARLRDRLTELLHNIGMPRTGGPIFEEEAEEVEESEPGNSVPDCSDPYVTEQSGHLVVMTWGAIYQTPSTLWQQRGSLQIGGQAHVS